jgi:hypothetical protein
MLSPHDAARAAHLIPHGALCAAAPGIAWDEVVTLRGEFATWCARQRRIFSSWQDAWNTWHRLDAHHTAGWLSLTPTRCSRCHGRRFDRRTGGICGECFGGTRRPRSHRVRVLYQPEPPQTRGP